MIYYWNTKKKQGVPLVSVDPGVSNVKKGIQYLINGVVKIGTYIPGFNLGNNNFSNVPNVGGAICTWGQKMVFTTITKTQVEFETVETKTETYFEGTWQPFTAQQLNIKPEGQRAWSWFTCHACTKLELKPDDIIFYKDIQYRVMSKLDYSSYGYYQYELILDYTGTP